MVSARLPPPLLSGLLERTPDRPFVLPVLVSSAALSRVGTELRNIHVANTGVIFVRNTEVRVRRIRSLGAAETLP